MCCVSDMEVAAVRLPGCCAGDGVRGPFLERGAGVTDCVGSSMACNSMEAPCERLVSTCFCNNTDEAKEVWGFRL